MSDDLDEFPIASDNLVVVMAILMLPFMRVGGMQFFQLEAPSGESLMRWQRVFSPGSDG